MIQRMGCPNRDSYCGNGDNDADDDYDNEQQPPVSMLRDSTTDLPPKLTLEQRVERYYDKGLAAPGQSIIELWVVVYQHCDRDDEDWIVCGSAARAIEIFETDLYFFYAPRKIRYAFVAPCVANQRN